MTTAHEPEGVTPPPVPPEAVTVATTADVSESDNNAVSSTDDEMKAQIEAAQKAADDQTSNDAPTDDKPRDVLFDELLESIAPPRRDAGNNQKNQNRRIGLGGRRHQRHHDRRDQVSAAPVVNHENHVEPKVEPAAHVVPPSEPAPKVEPPAKQLRPTTAVEPVVEDAEIADLRREKRPVILPKLEVSPINWRKFGAYAAIAALVVFIGYGLLKWLGGNEVVRETPRVPVVAVNPVTTNPTPSASTVVGDQLKEMNQHLKELTPTAAELKFLDDKITGAENAAIAQIAHVPCFKDPSQERCRKAVNAERDYFESDFSHPRDVALGKIPYTPPTNTNKVDKPTKKVGKNTKK